MNNVTLTGRIMHTATGSEASLIIPVGDYRIMVLSDDSCGAGKGEICRTELLIYHQNKKPCDNVNQEVFGSDFVIADSNTILKAINYATNKLISNEVFNAAFIGSASDSNGNWEVEFKDGTRDNAQMIGLIIEGIEGYTDTRIDNGDRIRISVEKVAK